MIDRYLMIVKCKHFHEFCGIQSLHKTHYIPKKHFMTKLL